ncbi:unnamed protein product [Protopolystoma xenopodis]|uniref:Uncharacterized protein n=1 Tax=Protopolystoma xenopodis TaxID=117903 RepID=A0A3S5B964_9PLAT|nr:unnamed protein product [Protopolystoma xenopodis]
MVVQLRCSLARHGSNPSRGADETMIVSQIGLDDKCPSHILPRITPQNESDKLDASEAANSSPRFELETAEDAQHCVIDEASESSKLPLEPDFNLSGVMRPKGDLMRVPIRRLTLRPASWSDRIDCLKSKYENDYVDDLVVCEHEPEPTDAPDQPEYEKALKGGVEEHLYSSINSLCIISLRLGSSLFSQLDRGVRETLWNVPSPVSSAIVFVISCLGPLT